MLKLSIETDEVRGVSIMKADGRVDSETAPELDQALTGLLNAKCDKIVINLTKVDFLSSAGLRAIVKAYQAAQRSGGDIRLAAVPEPVAVILHTVGLNQMLAAYPNDQEAIASF